MIKNDRNAVDGGYRPSFTTIDTLCLIIATALLLFPANRVLAQEIHVEKIFKVADADGNGLISEQEWQQLMQKRFEVLDTNSDGIISREEFERQKKSMRD